MNSKIRDALFLNGEFYCWADSEAGFHQIQTGMAFRLNTDGWERKPYIRPENMLLHAILNLRNAQRRMFAARRKNGDPRNKAYFERNTYLHLAREVNSPKLILSDQLFRGKYQVDEWLKSYSHQYKNIYIIELENIDKNGNQFQCFFGNVTENSFYHLNSKGNRY